MAATFDRLSNGRLLINVVTGGDPAELEGDGVFVDHDKRYEVTDEFLHIWRKLLEHRIERIDRFRRQASAVEGRQGAVSAGAEPASAAVVRRLVGGCARDRGRAHRHVPDVGRAARSGREEDRRHSRPRRREGPQDQVRHSPARDRARDRGRSVGRRRQADQQARRRNHPVRRHRSRRWTPKDSAAWRRCTAASAAELEVYPHLWAGVGLVRGGAGTALVGNPEQVAALMKEYAALGIDTFILSGYPHLEESYRFAELVFPLLPGEQKDRVAVRCRGRSARSSATTICRRRRARAERAARDDALGSNEEWLNHANGRC